MAPHRLYETQLLRLLDEINAPAWRIEDANGVEAELTELIELHPEQLDGYLWRGIVKRIQGIDPSADLEHVLRHDPSNRLALLNTIAAPITCVTARLEPGRVLGALQRAYAYLFEHPEDYFGHAVATALYFMLNPDTNVALTALEALYLRFEGCPPTSAMMAAVLQRAHRHQAAADFAQEALRLEPNSALAHNIVQANAGVEGLGPRRGPYRRFSAGPGLTTLDLAFMAPYAQQDVDYARLRPPRS